MRFKRMACSGAASGAGRPLEADPREVEFVAELPLTTTGKIMRRELDAERKGTAR